MYGTPTISVSWKDLRFLTGYPDGGFRPNNKITRAEFAVIISKFAAIENSKEGNFKDVNADHWAKKYADNAVSHGWMEIS